MRAGSATTDVPEESPKSPAGAALARRLGKFPFWRGSTALLEFLEPTYVAAARRAAETLEGK